MDEGFWWRKNLLRLVMRLRDGFENNNFLWAKVSATCQTSARPNHYDYYFPSQVIFSV